MEGDKRFQELFDLNSSHDISLRLGTSLKWQNFGSLKEFSRSLL